MPETSEIRSRIKRLIVDRLFLEGLDPEEIGDDAVLGEEFGLDSVDALELVLGMEQEFAVKIVEKGIDRDSFRTVATLADLVRARLEQHAGETSAP